MSKQEMIAFVEDQTSKGLDREDAIRLLAFFMDEDDPDNKAELWFQQMVGGG